MQQNRSKFAIMDSVAKIIVADCPLECVPVNCTNSFTLLTGFCCYCDRNIGVSRPFCCHKNGPLVSVVFVPGIMCGTLTKGL